MTTYPETRGGRNLKRGDTFDIEDGRTTHRLRMGQAILRDLGVTSTIEHGADCADRKHNLTGWTGCDYKCTTVWVEWATGPMFDLAWKLADEVQTKRGEYHRTRKVTA